MPASPPFFSVIIPVFNTPGLLEACMSSVLRADGMPAGMVEILVVDDCSTDDSWDVATGLVNGCPAARLFRTPANGGPGIARNIGVENARGTWILFLDSDDSLAPGALAQLMAFIERPESADCDAVGFDFRYADSVSGGRGRTDLDMLRQDGNSLRKSVLRLHMDGSVIYTAVRRSLIVENGIVFAPGYHEDVDYLFRIYWHARRVGCLDSVLYLKANRQGSIISEVSVRHIDGFVRAWSAIGQFLLQAGGDRTEGWLADWRIGAVAMVATRLREILARAGGPDHGAALLRRLHQGWLSLAAITGLPDLNDGDTRYFQMARRFDSDMRSGEDGTSGYWGRFVSWMEQLMAKSWSCTDLHHSVFLGPGEIRTCCKRFFVDGERRGDVVLFPVGDDQTVASSDILGAKQQLWSAINRDDPTPCQECPFLQFREWGAIAPLRISYLSFEYHSVCNLKCSYCSETYYGGEAPRYDVRELVSDIIDQGVLERDAAVVWGGGEPVIDRYFNPLIQLMADWNPGLTQRVLTNAVTFSETVERLLSQGRICVVTSLDAGTPATFARIRGHDHLDRVVRHLSRYAAAAPTRVTIKYIFTEANDTLEEIGAFVDLMCRAGLNKCGFQISCDFKSERAEEGQLVSAAAMYGQLVAAGARIVFFDDLLRHRLVGMDPAMEARIRGRLAALGFGSVLADPRTMPTVAIWGAGWQAKYLLERSAFFRQVKPAIIVDSTPEKIGGQFLGFPVDDPKVLCNVDMPIIIAATQGYAGIYEAFMALGLAPSRIVTQLIV